jgi:hypothetical protein
LIPFVVVCRFRAPLPVPEQGKPIQMQKEVSECPFVPVSPIVGVIICLILMAGLPIESWERLGNLMAIELVLYLLW